MKSQTEKQNYLKLDISAFEIPFDSFKSFINKYILSKWQTTWEGSVFLQAL